MLVKLLIHLLVTASLIFFIARHIKGVEVDSWWAALCGAVALGLINALLLPMVTFLTLPFTLMTFGLSLLVIHACLFKYSAALVSGFRLNGFMPAVYGSILLTLSDLVLAIFF